MQDKDREVQDRNKREKSIVLYRVPESDKTTVEGRMKDDTEFFTSLCTDALQVHDLQVDKVIRMGTKIEDKIRPIKVVFTNDFDKRKVMSRLYRLKGAEDRFQNVSVSHDLTLEERDQQRQLVQEAHKKKSEDETGEWDYKV